MDEEDDDGDGESCLCRYFKGIGMNDVGDGDCFCVFFSNEAFLTFGGGFCVRNFDTGILSCVGMDEDDDCFGIDDLL